MFTVLMIGFSPDFVAILQEEYNIIQPESLLPKQESDLIIIHEARRRELKELLAAKKWGDSDLPLIVIGSGGSPEVVCRLVQGADYYLVSPTCQELIAWSRALLRREQGYVGAP